LGDVLPHLGRVLPRSGTVLPLLGDVLPRLGKVLPLLGAVLPRLGKILPLLGAVLPRDGTVLPLFGNVVPRFGKVLFKRSWLGASFSRTFSGFAPFRFEGAAPMSVSSAVVTARRCLRLSSVLALLAFAACSPTNVADAERKADVAWLDQSGTPDAVAAMGRLADTHPDALAALEKRSSFDPSAFRASWDAIVRGADWGAAMLHAGLADPKRADLAASAVDKHDSRLVPFASDLEQALSRLSATMQNMNVSSALGAIGAPAHDAVLRRLTDPATRGAMCRGISSKDSSADARQVLLDAPVAARDASFCVDAVVAIAVDDDAALTWLAEKGEPGMLGAAGKGDLLPCARLHVAWTRALAARPPELYPALTVPLGYAVKRCTAEMDGVLADAIARLPGTHLLVIKAIDPFESYGTGLRATCAALPMVAGGRDSEVVKERARDALNHACRAPG
jgi:hypothetical protein